MGNSGAKTKRGRLGNSGAKAKRSKIGHDKRLMELVSSDQNVEELRKLLAQPGVNVNMGDSTRCENNTALMYAAYKGSLQCVKVLIEAGADVNVGDKKGQTALSYAAYSGSHECVNNLLVAGADVNKKNKNGCTALYYAVSGRPKN